MLQYGDVSSHLYGNKVDHLMAPNDIVIGC